MNYNEAEAYVDILFSAAAGLSDELVHEISSRINGIDGKIAVIKTGAKLLGLDPKDLEQLADALGGNWFGRIKELRDTVIHALIVNAPLAVGQRVARRADVRVAHLSKAALDAIYAHISAVRIELQSASALMMVARELKDLAPGDPKRELVVTNLRGCEIQFRSRRNAKRSLPPIPKLPSESELIAARDAWFQARISAQIAALQPLAEPPTRRRWTPQSEVFEPPSVPTRKKK